MAVGGVLRDYLLRGAGFVEIGTGRGDDIFLTQEDMPADDSGCRDNSQHTFKPSNRSAIM